MNCIKPIFYFYGLHSSFTVEYKYYVASKEFSTHLQPFDIEKAKKKMPFDNILEIIFKGIQVKF